MAYRDNESFYPSPPISSDNVANSSNSNPKLFCYCLVGQVAQHSIPVPNRTTNEPNRMFIQLAVAHGCTRSQPWSPIALGSIQTYWCVGSGPACVCSVIKRYRLSGRGRAPREGLPDSNVDQAARFLSFSFNSCNARRCVLSAGAMTALPMILQSLAQPRPAIHFGDSWLRAASSKMADPP